MRQPTATLAVAVTCVLIAGCSSTKGNVEATTSTRSMIPRPLVERELAGLLLSPEQVNAAMGATGWLSQIPRPRCLTTASPWRLGSAWPSTGRQRPRSMPKWFLGRARSEPQRRRSLHALSQAGSGVISSRGKSWRLLRCFRPAVARLPPVHPYAERFAVVRRADLQHERHTEYHRDSTECQCPRLGLWTRAGAQKQCHYRHQHVQR